MSRSPSQVPFLSFFFLVVRVPLKEATAKSWHPYSNLSNLEDLDVGPGFFGQPRLKYLLCASVLRTPLTKDA